jgi:MFS family permease
MKMPGREAGSALGKDDKDYNLFKAKALFFIVTLSVVGWTRFQNSFYIDGGLTNTEIGTLKSVGLLCKLVGEPLLCMLADLTGHKEMFLFCILFNALSIEMLRRARPLTFGTVMVVKVLRTFAAPTSTLTTTTTMALAEGTSQGYGEQRAFGALGWGVGALISGRLIDVAGMDALFYYTYALCGMTFLIVAFGVPRGAGRSKAGASKTETPEEEMALLLESDHSASAAGAGAGAGVEAGGARDAAAYSSAVDEISGSSEFSTKPRHKPLARRDGAAVATEKLSEEKTGFVSRFQHISDSVTVYYSVLCGNGGTSVKVMLLNCALFGVVMSAMDTYLYVSAERDLGASRTVNGLLTTISVAGSVPFFWYSDALMRRYGHELIFQVSFVVCIFRLVTCAAVMSTMMEHKPAALGVIACLQLLHGLTFGAYWSCVIDVVNALSARHGLVSGSVAIINALYFTVGGAIGNILWGCVYDEGRAWGGILGVYCMAAALAAAVLAVQVLCGAGVDEAVKRERSAEESS